MKAERALRRAELGGDGPGDLAAIVGIDSDRGDQPVVGMEWPLSEFCRQRLPGRQIDHVDGARRDDLRNAAGAGIFQPVGAGADDGTGEMVGDLLQAEIEHGAEMILAAIDSKARPPMPVVWKTATS